MPEIQETMKTPINLSIMIYDLCPGRAPATRAPLKVKSEVISPVTLPISPPPPTAHDEECSQHAKC
ncbi:unnamed protein product [Coregonus sp. 'balchen']|nr:unnamed protein product [Coregonus sp. 'balchen']